MFQLTNETASILHTDFVFLIQTFHYKRYLSETDVDSLAYMRNADCLSQVIFIDDYVAKVFHLLCYRLDEFCGQNTLDDVEFVRHSKQGIAFTQYVGEHHMPRVSSDGPRRYNLPRRPPHHLPRLHSDGSIPQRGNSQPQPRNANTGLTREQTVQHRSGMYMHQRFLHAH